MKSNITQRVDRLEDDGLAARKPDPNDRRSRLAVLTTAGRKAVKEGVRVLEAAERIMKRTVITVLIALGLVSAAATSATAQQHHGARANAAQLAIDAGSAACKGGGLILLSRSIT